MVKNNDDYAKEFANLIINQLEKGTAPWQRPWESKSHFMPYNPKSDINYTGANALILMAEQTEKGYTDNRWLTYKQAAEMGGQVQKGEKGTFLKYWRFTQNVVKKDENGQDIIESVPLSKPILNIFAVFNAEQINGLPLPEKKQEIPQWEAIKRVDDTVKNCGARIEHLPNQLPCYVINADKIVLPFKNQFKTEQNYYGTLLHELGHWTGHEDRLNRNIKNPYGSEEYAKEELRAEIASMMLEDKFSIKNDEQNERHAAYVNSWIKILNDDPKEIFRAAADAQKMTNFITKFISQKQDLKQDIDTKVYLNVPYKEKEEVKELGAKWDKQEKSWYIQGKDLKPFEKWLNNKEKEVIYQDNVQDQFKNRLLEAGLIVDNVQMDGKTHRVPVDSDKRGAKSGSYKGYLDGRPAGSFINYKTGEFGNWKADAPKRLTPKEKERLITQAKINHEIREKEVIEKQEKAANIAKEVVKFAIPASNNHTYLLKKHINADFIFQANEETIKKANELLGNGHNIKNGDLIVPMLNNKNEIRSLQIIKENGFKGFLAGGQVTGLYNSLGEKKEGKPIWIAEGLATAKSLHEATGDQVIVAFNASNLIHVGEEIRKANPDSDIYFGADNDRHLPLKEPPLPNVGIEKATEAANKINGLVIVPSFGSERDGVDWNDVAQVEGLDGLVRELKDSINQSILNDRLNKPNQKDNKNNLVEDKEVEIIQDAISNFRSYEGGRNINKIIENSTEEQIKQINIESDTKEKTHRLSRKIGR